MALKRIMAILCLIILPLSGFSAEWKIDSSKSSIHFKAIQNNSPVTGEFKSFSGEIFFDKDNLSKSHLTITVDTASILTSLKEVSDTLKTSEWFDTKIFPHAIFTADHFKKLNNDYECEGKLTLRNITLPVTLNFKIEKYGDTEALISGDTHIKRTAFDIGKGEWKSTQQIKDDVEVDFTIAATKDIRNETH